MHGCAYDSYTCFKTMGRMKLKLKGAIGKLTGKHKKEQIARDDSERTKLLGEILDDETKHHEIFRPAVLLDMTPEVVREPKVEVPVTPADLILSRPIDRQIPTITKCTNCGKSFKAFVEYEVIWCGNCEDLIDKTVHEWHTIQGPAAVPEIVEEAPVSGATENKW